MSGRRKDGIVPIPMELIGLQMDGFELLIGDLDAFGIGRGIELGAHPQAAASAGVSDEVDHHLMTDQRLTAPIHGDEGE